MLNKPAPETFTFRAGTEGVPIVVTRPLGVIFEEKKMDEENCIFAQEIVEGSNAEKAGVKVRGGVHTKRTPISRDLT